MFYCDRLKQYIEAELPNILKLIYRRMIQKECSKPDALAQNKYAKIPNAPAYSYTQRSLN